MSHPDARTWAHTFSASLVLMAPFDLLASLAMDVYLPVTPYMPVALNASPFLVQLSLILYLLVLGVGQVVFGPLSDRVGRRPVVLGGASVFTIASFGLAIVNDGAQFLAFRMLQATGASAALVGMFATVRDVFGGRPEGSAVYGVLSAMLAIVPGSGPILGASLAANFGWRSIFFMLSGAAALALLHAWPRWHETAPHSLPGRELGFVAVLASRVFWMYTLGFSSAMGAFFVFFSIAPSVLIDVAGYSPMKFSIAFSSVAGVMILASRFGRRFIADWGVRGSFARGTALMIVGVTVMAVCAVFTRPGFFSFVMPMWIVASGMILIVSVSANGALGAFDDVAGTSVALYFAIQALVVSGVGTLMIVVFGGDNPWPLVAYGLVMCLINAFGLMALERRAPAAA